MTHLEVLKQDLDPGLPVVLTVGHQADAAALEQLQQVLAALHHVVGGRLDVVEVLVQLPHPALRLAQLLARQVPLALQLLAPHLELAAKLQRVPLEEAQLEAEVQPHLARGPELAQLLALRGELLQRGLHARQAARALHLLAGDRLQLLHQGLALGDGAHAGVQRAVPLRAELLQQPLRALVRLAHLLAGQLGLELREPVAELLHVGVEEDGELEDVSPLLDPPGEAADVRLELPRHAVDVVRVALPGLRKLLSSRQQLLGVGVGVLKRGNMYWLYWIK